MWGKSAVHLALAHGRFDVGMKIMMSKKLHYAWVVMAGCFIILMCLSGMVLATTSVFLKPVSESMGIARTAFTSYTLLSGVFGMAASLNAGKIIRSLGIRIALIMGAGMVSAAMFGYAVSREIWHFWIFGALSGFGAGFSSTIICSVLLNNWFHAQKGVATSIAFMGTSTGTLVFSRIGILLLEHVGWRWSYAIFGFILLLLVPSVAIFLVVEAPSSKGLAPYGADREDVPSHESDKDGILKHDFLKMPAFYTLSLSCFLSGIIILGAQNHLLAFLDDLGYTTQTAANVYTIYLIIQIIGKVILGASLDRFGVKISILYISVMYFLAMAGFLSAKSPVMAFLGAACLGLAAGICTLLPPYLTSVLVGSIDYANILGSVNIFLSMGTSVSTMFTSVVYDYFGGYHWAWIIYAIGMVLYAFCVFSSLATVNSKKQMQSQPM